jgi:hypothetical protein
MATGRFDIRLLASERGSSEQLEPGACVETVLGDLDDRASLRGALRACVAVFADVASGDEAQEATRGRNLINAVAGAEIDYLVLCTRSADLQAYARGLELPATFIRLLAGTDVPFESIGDAVVQMFENPAAYVGQRLAIGAALCDSSTLANNRQQPEEWS